jgi:CoA-transferase family III
VATTVPLSGWADRQLLALADGAGADAIKTLSGATLLGERAILNGFRVPGRVSAGGGCRLFETRTGYVALNLSRPDDRATLPALFGDAGLDGDDDLAVAERFLEGSAIPLVAQGQVLGLAIAALDDRTNAGASCIVASGCHADAVGSRPLVIDLSALWAGPLAARLLRLTDAKVVKVESANRPDAMRGGNSGLFERLNDGKEHRMFDLRDPGGRDALIALIRRADVVIEASRPRALRQLGIDADALVREVPGLVWATITGHGALGEAANWVGFGDDTGVAGGLSAAMRDATGVVGFVGDAIGDPLTGIYAARKIVEQRATGHGARLCLSMAAVVAEALADEQAHDPTGLERGFALWAKAEGQAFPAC